ncbi:MAG: EAL and HDOD domain-containing protein [Marinobacter sp.]
MASQTLLAAQPIYNRDSQMEAVELLYRDDQGRSALTVGEQRATSEVLFNFCTGITDHATQYGARAYINVSTDFLLSGIVLPVDPDTVMIELVERIDPTPELVAAVRRWYDLGFRFALDDFAFRESWAPLLEMASVIKVDVSQFTPEAVARNKAALEHLPVRWLAERVEDEETRDQYRNMGFDLFQGYFLARPRLISGQKMSPSGLQLTRLLSALYRPDPDVGELTRVLSQDPELSLNLIRIVNSPLYRGQGRIASVREVILRLGLANLRHWVAMLSAMQTVNREQARLVLTRAYLCEALAERVRDAGPDREQAFLTGLLSGAEIMLGVSPDEFIDSLNLHPDMRKAILYHKGRLGRVLRLALTLEQAVAMGTNLDQLDSRLLSLYDHAASQVQQLIRELQPSPSSTSAPVPRSK